MKLVAFSVLVILLSGCAGFKIVDDRKEFTEVRKVKNYSYIFYVPFFRNVVEPTDMNRVCDGDDWKEISMSNDLFGGVLQILTIGIIHPEETKAICKN